MGPSPPVRNAVRFAFWGAEELGLKGSTNYVESLDVDELKNIALYLNFDMLASPNPGYFTYDGDQSAPPDPDRSPPRVPEGSAGIERDPGRLSQAGRKDRRRTPTSTAGRTTTASPGPECPPGGLFSGAEEKMTREQAELWGGQADEPFDPNYHKKTDTLDHIDRAALGINGARRGLRRRALRTGPAAAATACRSATTAPGTCSRIMTSGLEPRGDQIEPPAAVVDGYSRCSVGCSSAPAPAKTDLARDLADAVTADGMFHLRRPCRSIADANDGSRADGTPGYDASVDYVAKALRDKGFRRCRPRIRAAGRERTGEPDADRGRPGYPSTRRRC